MSIYSKKCKVFTFHETFLIFSGVLHEISQGPKGTSQIWIGLCFFLLIVADAHWEGLHDEPKEHLWGRGGAACGTASFQSNCPNQDRSQLICLFPYRVSVSRTIKPILETGCCAKQRPPDFFSQKVILFCVTGIK